jgi:serine/threonine protein phosphatase PrpC
MNYSQDPSLRLDSTPVYEQFPVAAESIKLGGNRQGGELTLDLESLTPLIDAQTFNAETGFLGALMTEVKMGGGTYGIVDTGAKHKKSLGLSEKDIRGWAGSHQVYEFSSDLLFVQLNKWHDASGGVHYRTVQSTHQPGKPVATGLVPPLTVGRKAERLYQRGFIFSAAASGEHARLTFDAEKNLLHIEDLQSLNGTTIVKARTESGQEGNKTAAVTQHTGKVAVKRERLHDEKVGIAKRELKGEDTILSRPTERLFGVFDGLGGHNHADLASNWASATVEGAVLQSLQLMEAETRGRTKPADIEELLIESLTEANRAVTDKTRGGMTTASVVKLHTYKGNNYAIWASVGDSRIYTYNRYSRALKQVTVDETLEGMPNVLINSVGAADFTVRQHGVLRLEEGDMVMLCSDGITGDYGRDVLSNHELTGALQKASSTQEAANNLLAISRKSDDKSVVVVQP